jgi:hypothetical protein
MGGIISYLFGNSPECMMSRRKDDNKTPNNTPEKAFSQSLIRIGELSPPISPTSTRSQMTIDEYIDYQEDQKEKYRGYGWSGNGAWDNIGEVEIR